MHLSCACIFHSVLKTLHKIPVMYLYDIHQGDDSKPNSHNLSPMLDDIVIFQTSDKKRKFGLIIEILQKNMIKVKTTLHDPDLQEI